jgi:hypothetical protein
MLLRARPFKLCVRGFECCTEAIVRLCGSRSTWVACEHRTTRAIRIPHVHSGVFHNRDSPCDHYVL